MKVVWFAALVLAAAAVGATPDMDAVLTIPPHHDASPKLMSLRGALPNAQWNLDRVDQAFGLDGLDSRPRETGVGVDVYVLDTGVFAEHACFGGRVERGVDTTSGNLSMPGNVDCNGHGTHVASTAAGAGFGMATGAAVIPVKFMDCSGQGTMAALSAATRWIRASIASRPNRKPIVSVSAESDGNSVIDAYMQLLWDAGAIVVVAAGNRAGDACNVSPARFANAITVGASSPDDTILAQSNRGPCVDVFAPGDSVIGASNLGVTRTATKYGTSMATPLVAGIAATLWERFPDNTFDQIASRVVAYAKPNACGLFIAQTWAARMRPRRTSVKTFHPLWYAEFTQWKPELAFSGCVTFAYTGSAVSVQLMRDACGAAAATYTFACSGLSCAAQDGTAGQMVQSGQPLYVRQTGPTQLELGWGDGSVSRPTLQVNASWIAPTFSWVSFAGGADVVVRNVSPCGEPLAVTLPTVATWTLRRRCLQFRVANARPDTRVTVEFAGGGTLQLSPSMGWNATRLTRFVFDGTGACQIQNGPGVVLQLDGATTACDWGVAPTTYTFSSPRAGVVLDRVGECGTCLGQVC